MSETSQEYELDSRQHKILNKKKKKLLLWVVFSVAISFAAPIVELALSFQVAGNFDLLVILRRGDLYGLTIALTGSAFGFVIAKKESLETAAGVLFLILLLVFLMSITLFLNIDSKDASQGIRIAWLSSSFYLTALLLSGFLVWGAADE